MPLRNNTESFGWLAKAFHWTIALMIIFLWSVGQRMTGMDNNPFKFQIYALHKSLGLTVLALAVFAFTWRATNLRPAYPAHVAKLQGWAADMVKYGLYICMFAMPISGLLMSQASGFPVSVYGLFTVPELIAVNKPTAELFEDIHGITGWILLALVIMHAGAALLHHFYYKDGILKRMLPFR